MLIFTSCKVLSDCNAQASIGLWSMRNRSRVLIIITYPLGTIEIIYLIPRALKHWFHEQWWLLPHPWLFQETMITNNPESARTMQNSLPNDQTTLYNNNLDWTICGFSFSFHWGKDLFPLSPIQSLRGLFSSRITIDTRRYANHIPCANRSITYR